MILTVRYWHQHWRQNSCPHIKPVKFCTAIQPNHVTDCNIAPAIHTDTGQHCTHWPLNHIIIAPALYTDKQTDKDSHRIHETIHILHQLFFITLSVTDVICDVLLLCLLFPCIANFHCIIVQFFLLKSIPAVSSLFSAGHCKHTFISLHEIRAF